MLWKCQTDLTTLQHSFYWGPDLLGRKNIVKSNHVQIFNLRASPQFLLSKKLQYMQQASKFSSERKRYQLKFNSFTLSVNVAINNPLDDCWMPFLHTARVLKLHLWSSCVLRAYRWPWPAGDTKASAVVHSSSCATLTLCTKQKNSPL